MFHRKRYQVIQTTLQTTWNYPLVSHIFVGNPPRVVIWKILRRPPSARRSSCAPSPPRPWRYKSPCHPRPGAAEPSGHVPSGQRIHRVGWGWGLFHLVGFYKSHEMNQRLINNFGDVSYVESTALFLIDHFWLRDANGLIRKNTFGRWSP